MQADAGRLGPGSGKDAAQGSEKLLQAVGLMVRVTFMNSATPGSLIERRPGSHAREAVTSSGSVIFFSSSQGCAAECCGALTSRLAASLAWGGMNGHHTV